MFVELLALTVFLLSILLFKRNLYLQKWDHFPGPKSWQSLPFIGHAYLLGDDPVKAMLAMKKKYGNIFRLDVGNNPNVVIAGLDEANEAYKRDVHAGRTKMPGIDSSRGYDPEGGVNGPVFSTGQKWKDVRKLFTSSLRALGMGDKNKMDSVIREEAEAFCQSLEKRVKESNNDGIIEVNHMFLNWINNIIYRIGNGKEMKLYDKETVDGLQGMHEVMAYTNPSSFYNVLQNNSAFFLWLFNAMGLKTVRTVSKPFQRWLQKQMDVAQPDKDGYFLDRFFAAMEKANAEGDPNGTFYGDRGVGQTFGALHELYTGGIDTTSVYLEYCVYYLMAYPEIQEKILESVVKVCGKRQPTISDKEDMPYVEAFMEEMSRHCPMTFFALPHSTLEDTTLAGYQCPKDTMTYLFTGGIHLDDEHFEDAKKFKPERFLDENNNFVGPSNKVLWFGCGKRRCAGEALGRAEMFMNLVCLVQRFRFEAPPGFKPTFKSRPGIVFVPENFEAKFVLRENM